MQTLGSRLQGISANRRTPPTARRPVLLWSLAVLGLAAAMLGAAHLADALNTTTIVAVALASAGLAVHLAARHNVRHWPDTCRACRAMSGGGGRNLCRHHEDLRPLVLMASAAAAALPVTAAIVAVSPMLIIASPIGLLIGYAAARHRGFSIAGGLIAGALLGPLAIVLFLVSGRAR